MNELTVIEETMSSQQIAELLDKRHDTVKVSMERLKDREVISFTSMTENPTSELGGRPVEIYHVNERDSYVVVAQLSPEFTALIVDHWRQLRGENMELKALVAEQGKKIDQLCAVMLNPLVTANPTPLAQPQKRATGFTRKRVYNYNVIEVKAKHIKGEDIPTIADTTGFSILTVQRILRGERDYLLKP